MKIFESGHYFDVFSLYIKDKRNISEEKYNIKQINPIIENTNWVLNKDLEEEEVEEVLNKVEKKRNKIIQIALEEREEIENVYGISADKIDLESVNEIDRNKIKNKVLSIEKRATDTDIYSLIHGGVISYIELDEDIEVLPKEYGGNINIYGKLDNSINDYWCIVLRGNKDIKSIIESKETYYLEGICIPLSYINNNKFYKKIRKYSKEDVLIDECYYYIDLSLKGKCKLGLQEWPKASKEILKRYIGNLILNEECPYYGRIGEMKSKDDIDRILRMVENTKRLIKELTCSGVINTIESI